MTTPKYPTPELITPTKKQVCKSYEKTQQLPETQKKEEASKKYKA